jgi:hypothetical protein
VSDFGKLAAKVREAIEAPSAKVRSEAEFFDRVLAEIGIDFASLSAIEAIACQDVAFSAWQSSPERRAEREAEEAERVAKRRAEAIEAAKRRADRDEEAERVALAKLAKIRERRELRESAE